MGTNFYWRSAYEIATSCECLACGTVLTDISSTDTWERSYRCDNSSCSEFRNAKPDCSSRGDYSELDCHIGKRSAAGGYCWDCGTTLCREGTRMVHYSKSERFGGEIEWSRERCTVCGVESKKTEMTTSAAVELGFKDAAELPRKGVSSCSSFTWTLMSHKWRLQKLLNDGCTDKVVINEYGECFTAREFLVDELHSVAIESQHAAHFC